MELPFIAAKGGMVISPLHTTLSARDLIFLLNNAGANTIVFTENYLNTIINIRPELESVKNLIVIGKLHDNMKSYEDLVAEYPSEEPDCEVDDNALLFLPCSGGRPVFQNRSCIPIKLASLSCSICSGLSRASMKTFASSLFRYFGGQPPLICYFPIHIWDAHWS